MTKPDSNPELDSETVSKWLESHPDFFLNHAELMSALVWPDETATPAGATSMMEFQSRRLKSELSKLREQLQTLTLVAKDNEGLMLRLHLMTLSLMVQPAPQDFVLALFSTLREQFGADVIALHLLNPADSLDELESVFLWSAQDLSWTSPIDGLQTPQCGRFTQQKLNSLFPEATLKIQSAAMVPMAGIGLLAIGSTDQAKFQPQMGTLFLELLATTIVHCLSANQSPTDERN